VLRSVQVRSKLVAPDRRAAQLWGLLIAHDCQQPRSWSQADRDFLRQGGEYLAVAIAQTAIVLFTPSLEEALIAAESASRAKSEFLANISHELRTPLTTVIGMSATLLRWSIGELNARQRQYLQTIHDSGDRLLQLINDILDLSQVESGRAVLSLSDFSLTHLAHAEFAAYAGQRDRQQSCAEAGFDDSAPVGLLPRRSASGAANFAESAQQRD
ncbi:MAG: GAF domain-containing protein, partial [Leptolyngbyaceae cyanobacterium SM1_3_5]|nr:GAF domain-containing protein [Leptolyngbyaceae cyanobacterium SM1_3_5]